jgi:predicted glycosyltransferase involved in capsule biosynthesis
MRSSILTQIAVVTIVDLIWRGKQLIERISSLAVTLAGTEFELVIGHADRGQPADSKLRRRMAAFDDVKLVSVTPKGVEQELARLRNVAVAATKSPILILTDADIYPDVALFRSLTMAVAAGEFLSMAPCIYLTEAGNRIIAQEAGGKRVIDSALDFSREFVLHWAIPSSVMAFRHADYCALGGFHEAYVGHGYEDFDFMLRLAAIEGLVSPSTDLLLDIPYKAPLLSLGFRAALGRLCIPNLLSGNIAFHLHHEKDRQSVYQKRRESNAMIFQSRINEWVETISDKSGYSSTARLIDLFFLECIRRGLDPSRYFSLFDARPKHLVSSHGWQNNFVKKIRGFLALWR